MIALVLAVVVSPSITRRIVSKRLNVEWSKQT